MGDTLQDVYAKYLPKDYGYPLRTPEPSNTLPESYQNDGLHIGDVGYVDDYGRFQVLFNIHHSTQHELHRKRGVPADFEPVELDPEEVDVVHNAIPTKHVIRPPHLKQQLQLSEDSLEYEFVASSTGAGAILILPFGAARHDLKEKEEYCKIAADEAHRWCTFARRDSLYLLTGFHKTRSWSLASFHNAERAGRIRVIRRTGEHDNVGVYDWEHTFPVDRRDGPVVDEHGNENQTVFISGFKIAVRWWAQEPMIVWVPQSGGFWFTLYLQLSWFGGFLFGLVIILWRRFTPKSLEHVPTLSQPFHPSDVINRYLLQKNPNAHVAVTHDSQWINILDQEELSYQDLAQEGRLWEVLSEKYTCVSDDDAVYLQGKSEDSDTVDFCNSVQEFQGFSLHTNGNVQIVITHLRAENVATASGYIPVGFNVLVRADGTERRTKNKPLLLQENIIEWDDEFFIPSDSTVRVQLSVCACFEFDPMLGHGEVLYMCEISPEQLVGNTYLITLPPREPGPCPSLLLTFERRRVDYIEADKLQSDSLGSLVEATDNGHGALLRFYKARRKEDLERSIEQFEHAITLCPPAHDCRTPALFNLGTAKLINSRVYGASSDLNAAISLYLEALESRSHRHPDRSATLLRLAQALLHRYRVQGNEESVAGQIEQLVTELRTLCPDASHERRAADLVLQTLNLLKAVYSYPPADLDNLVLELDQATRASPEDYFDRPDRLENLRVALLARCKLRHDVTDADRAISMLEEAVRLIPDDHPDKHTYMINLGNSLLVRFEIFGDAADLEQAVARHEDGVCLTPEYLPDLAGHLCDHGISLRARFEQLGDLHDINSAIEKQEYAITLTPDGHSDSPRRLYNLGLSLRVRFERLVDLADIDSAIKKQEEAVRLSAEHHPQFTTWLSNLGVSFRIRFEHLGHHHDIDDAISRQTNAVQLTPEDHPERARLLDDLARYLTARFNLLGESRDIEQAIARHAESLQITPREHPFRPRRLHNLGLSHKTRFDRFGDLHDLEQAIARLQEVVESTPKDTPEHPLHLNDLGLAFYSRFNRLGDLKDVGQAIARQEEAIELIPRDHPDYARHLNCLGRSKWTRFKRLADLSDIEQAIGMQEVALTLTPQDDPNYAAYLNDLGLSYLARFGHAGDIHDLELAFEKHEEAVQLTPDDHPIRPRHLNSLGLTLWARFSRIGGVHDIEEAIKLHTDAIQHTSPDHPNHSSYRNDLALSLRSRFNQLGNWSDLEQAIATWEDVVSLTPLDNPLRAYYLSNLGPCFNALFSRNDNPEYIDRAINIEREAIELTPDDHPDRPRLLNNLAHSSMTRFNLRSDLEDLDQAISMEQKVVELTPERNPYRPLFLSNLGHFFKTRFERSGSVDDIDQAIARLQDALNLTPRGDPEYGHRVRNLQHFQSARRTRGTTKQ